jgi:hypothetical protein
VNLCRIIITIRYYSIFIYIVIVRTTKGGSLLGRFALKEMGVCEFTKPKKSGIGGIFDWIIIFRKKSARRQNPQKDFDMDKHYMVHISDEK